MNYSPRVEQTFAEHQAPRRRSWTRTALCGLALAGVACTAPVIDPRPEIPADAALTVCTVAKDLRERALDRAIWPVFPPPDGLYLGRFDAHATYILGFAAKTPVCLTLMAPTQEEVSQAQTQTARLGRVLDDIANEAADLGGCVCAQAFQQGVRDLIASCRSRNPMEGCATMNDTTNARLRTALERLHAAAQQAFIPPRHWRLVGTTDRPGIFVRESARIIGGFSVGSEVFVPGDERGSLGPNEKLLAAMLSQPYVVAVVRQDRGKGLLVVRQRFDGQYLLDLFEHDLVQPAANELRILWDNAQIGWYLEALRPPSQAWSSPRKTIEDEVLVYDRDALSRVLRTQQLGASRPDESAQPADNELELVRRLEAYRTEDGLHPKYEVELELSKKLVAALQQQAGSDPFTSVEALYQSAQSTGKAPVVPTTGSKQLLAQYFPPDDYAMLDIFMHALRSKPLKLAGTPTSWTLMLDESLLARTLKNLNDSPWQTLVKRLGEPESELKGEVSPESSTLTLKLQLH